MKKLYYAYVTKDMMIPFEKRLDELEDYIEVVRISRAVSENGERLFYYVLEAEEGFINSKWELKQ